MRGDEADQGHMFSYISAEKRVPADHPRRKVRVLADATTTSIGRARPGYRMSQVARQRVEPPFGWIKAVAGLLQLQHRGLAKVNWVFTFASATYNLVRLRNLTTEPA